MTHILLLATGGTIASRYDAALGSTVAQDPANALAAGLSIEPGAVALRTETFANIGSYAIDLPMAFALAQRILAAVAEDGCLGVAVTHGTDTMEESAFLADLLLASDRPVIFTGAQRAADDPAPDGPDNLRDALRAIASGQLTGSGVLVGFAGTLHAAREVAKVHASALQAFASPGYGPVGRVDQQTVELRRQPLRRAHYAPAALDKDVFLIRLTLGSDARLLHLAVDAGAHALVVEAFGRGNAPPAVTHAIGEIVAAGVPVVICTRCAEGRVSPVYGAGGGYDLARLGALFAGDLPGHKARVLLSVLLGCGYRGERLREQLGLLAP
jgi:L-asparaginase